MGDALGDALGVGVASGVPRPPRKMPSAEAALVGGGRGPRRLAGEEKKPGGAAARVTTAGGVATWAGACCARCCCCCCCCGGGGRALALVPGEKRSRGRVSILIRLYRDARHPSPSVLYSRGCQIFLSDWHFNENDEVVVLTARSFTVNGDVY